MGANIPKRASDAADGGERPIKRRALSDQSALNYLNSVRPFIDLLHGERLQDMIRDDLLPHINRCYPACLNPQYLNKDINTFKDLWNKYPTLANDIKEAVSAGNWAAILELGKL
jgi:hypothetical protein